MTAPRLLLGLAWFLASGLAVDVRAQISPGDLAEAHESLEGVKNCLKCHKLGAGPSAEKCLECHQAIAEALGERRGYHYRVVTQQKRTCFECHSDHAGRGFQLIHWPGGIDDFKHEETGYILRGAHAKLECRRCHNAAFVRDVGRFANHVDPKRTFLGLSGRCIGCHVDEHRGQLAQDCLGCHTDDSWKPAGLFDHDRTRYVLTGQHRRAACEKCHPMVREAPHAGSGDVFYRKYKGIAAGTCATCHKDVHRGKLGPNCVSCHSTEGWLTIAGKGFDHSKTRFPLEGLHASVSCGKCHKDRSKTAVVSFGRCVDCHTDPHRGQLARRADQGACEACHSVAGFVPALFTTADHEQTRYPLTGAHLAQPCSACHAEIAGEAGDRYRLYEINDTSCTGCHRDVHAGQFQASEPKRRCEDCHRVTEWVDVAFDHDVDSSYRLVGAHREVPCQGCHLVAPAGEEKITRYRPIDHSCKTCHDIEPGTLSDRTAGRSP